MALLYPPEWTVSYSGLSYPDIVGLYSPVENLTDVSPPAQITLSLTTFRQNVSLAEYTNQSLALLSQGQDQDQNQTQLPISIRTSDPVTVAGYPGHRISYMVSDGQTNVVVMQMWTLVDGNKLYVVTYTADANNFERNLSDATLIIDSPNS